jgi:hypothetical protein
MAIVANRHWILLALLAAAVVSYGVGSIAGLGLFVAAGVVWFEVIKRRRRRGAAQLRR